MGTFQASWDDGTDQKAQAQPRHRIPGATEASTELRALGARRRDSRGRPQEGAQTSSPELEGFQAKGRRETEA